MNVTIVNIKIDEIIPSVTGHYKTFPVVVVDIVDGDKVSRKVNRKMFSVPARNHEEAVSEIKNNSFFDDKMVFVATDKYFFTEDTRNIEFPNYFGELNFFDYLIWFEHVQEITKTFRMV